MAKLKNILMVLALVAFANVAIAAQTFLPMAIKGEIPNPTVFAERIEESLETDPTGATTIRGANVDPNGVLTAVRVAGGTVGSLEGLASYLRSLGEGDMPKGTINLSRAASPVGHMVDTSQGWARGAHPGERGWYDMNTGLLILAGDCSNSPTTPISRGNAVPQPKVAMAKPRPRRDPYAGANRCEFGPPSMYVTVHLMEPAAAEYLQTNLADPVIPADQCSVRSLVPADGRVQGSDPGTWRSHDKFSETCGRLMNKLAVEDRVLNYATTRRTAEVYFVDAKSENPLFTGFVTGDGNFETSDIASQQNLALNGKAVRIPTKYHNVDGDVVMYVEGDLPSGTGKHIREFKMGCRAMTYTMIDGYYTNVKIPAVAAAQQ
jgi:hypothetical protein